MSYIYIAHIYAYMCIWMRGLPRWFTPVACGPGSPGSSECNSDMAGKVFTVTITFKCGLAV